MNLTKFKITSLILLLITFLLISAFTFFGSSRETVSEEGLKNTIELFKAEGVSIKGEAVPRELSRLKTYTAKKKSGTELKTTAAHLLSSPINTSNLLIDGYLFLADSGGTFSYNSTDCYLTASLSPSYLIGEKDIDAIEALQILPSAGSPHTPPLEEYGKESLYQYRYKGLMKSAAENGAQIKYSRFDMYIENTLVYDSALYCAEADGEIVGWFGKTVFSELDEGNIAQQYDLLNILISELFRLQEIKAENGNILPDEYKEISGISACYLRYQGKEESLIYFVPGWEITYVSGKKAYYNASTNNCHSCS